MALLLVPVGAKSEKSTGVEVCKESKLLSFLVCLRRLIYAEALNESQRG